MPAVSPEILARIEEAYQGEVFGLAMYAAIADAQADRVRRWKLQVLTQLEADTKAQIAGLLERLGGTPASRSIRAGTG